MSKKNEEIDEEKSIEAKEDSGKGQGENIHDAPVEQPREVSKSLEKNSRGKDVLEKKKGKKNVLRQRGNKKIVDSVVRPSVSEIKASASYLRISPFKLRRVANVVRGKSVSQALSILKRLPHKGAGLLYKVLYSAQSNAKENFDYNNAFSLKVSTLMINEGSRSKRFQPKGRGRIYQILKRTSHVQVVLTTDEGDK